MKRLALWSIQIFLVVACARASAWEPYPPGAVPNSGKTKAFTDWLGGPEKPAPRPAAKPAKAKTPPAGPGEAPAPASKPPAQMDEGVGAREQELQALLRRQKVCFQLMQIALENNDPELMRKAEQLDERARMIYSERTAAMPGFADRDSSADEKMLEKQLGSARAAGREAPARAAGRPRDTHSVSEARVGEDRP